MIFKPSKKMKLELLEARRRAARDKMSGVFFSHCCSVVCYVVFDFQKAFFRGGKI